MRLVAALVCVLAACGDNVRPGDAAADRSGSRLELYWRRYEGGARELASRSHMFDATLDLPCDLMTWADGVVRCTPTFGRLAPREPFGRVVFTDPACSLPIGSSVTDPVPFLFVAAWVGDDLVPERGYEVGLVVPTPTATFEVRDGACVPLSVDGPRQYFGIGRELPLDHFVAMRRTTLYARGRLAHVADLGDDGSSIWRGYRDTELEADCDLVAANALERACGPHDAYPIDRFADADCTEPLARVTRERARFGVRRHDDVHADYFELAESYAGPVFAQAQDRCVHVAATEPLLRIGAPLELATIKRVHRGNRRLADIVFEHDDLASPSSGLFDMRFHSRCRGFPFDRCIPLTAPVEEHFTTPACDVKTAVANPPEDDGVDQFTVASTGSAFFAIGRPITIYRGAACLPDRFVRYALGPGFGYEAFESAMTVVE